jgi:hypothetical protein
LDIKKKGSDMTREQRLPVETKKGSKVNREPVHYKDSHGKSWSAVPGEPNGCFQVAGDPTLFSTQSFLDMMKRTVATVKVVGEGEVVEAGDVQFEDALTLMGEPTPRKLDETRRPKAKKEQGPPKKKNVDKIKEFLETRPQGATKKEIVEGTGIPITSVNNDVKNEMFQVAGKSGAQNKYCLRS